MSNAGVTERPVSFRVVDVDVGGVVAVLLYIRTVRGKHPVLTKRFLPPRGPGSAPPPRTPSEVPRRPVRRGSSPTRPSSRPVPPTLSVEEGWDV